jgi:TonB family protein
MDSTPKLTARSVIGDVWFEQGAQGIWAEYYPSGKRKTIKHYVDGKITGDVTEFYPNGNKYIVETYVRDSVYMKNCWDESGAILAENGHGKWLRFDENFRLREEGTINYGLKDGEWKTYLETGKVINSSYNKGVFDMAKQVKNATLNNNNPEGKPSFNGGQVALDKYLRDVLIYPSFAGSLGIRGRVAMKFMVEEDGSLSDISVTMSPHESLSNKCIRTVKNMPRWIPAKVNGKPVKAEYRLIINFAIIEDNSKVGNFN